MSEMDHFLDVGAFLNEARSTPKNGHRQFDPSLPKSAKGRHRQRHRNEINHALIRTRVNCYFASTRSSEKRPAPVTKIVNAPPMIEIFFRKLLYWPICCGPAGYSQYRCSIAVVTT